VIDQAVVQRVLGTALRTGGEWAEVFVEDRRMTAARLDDGRIEEMTSGRDRGAGVRVVVGDTTGFAHTADLTEVGLAAAAEAAAAVARAGGADRSVELTSSGRHGPRAEVLPETIAKAAKVELLQRADDAARSEGGSVRQVSAMYQDSRRRILVANSDGLLAEDDQVRTDFIVQAVAAGDTGMQTGAERIARTIGFEYFDRYDVEDMARRAAQQALVKLQARPAPSGPMTVVVGPGQGAFLFHEACGHGLEYDHIAKGASAYVGKVGEQVASPLVTLVDDGTPADEWGTTAIDDEGRPVQRNVLIENGILTDYMYDFLRARKEGRPSSANGRRQSYKFLPIPRMTNTYIDNGTEDPEEIIRQTPQGVFIKRLGGGQVGPNGDFVFGMTEAYMIEDGQLTDPLRGANLIGNGPEVLRAIDALGNDFEFSQGTCGKDGQSVPVGVGQPTLRLSRVTIGGTAGA
jgi:TldD protein